MKRILHFAVIAAAVVMVAVILTPVAFFGATWLKDPKTPLAPPAAGVDDASHLDENHTAEVIPLAQGRAALEEQLRGLVRRAVAEHKPISISGAHHSMGGHTISPHGIVLDTSTYHEMELDQKNLILTVDAGARWWQVISYLDAHGLAVRVMQSNNDFSVGGSISVNCHGWQNDSEPIASTVESLRLLTADGTIRTCSRTENPELFSLVLGGYGLFGVILDVKLHVVPNEYYLAEAHRVTPADYNKTYHDLTHSSDDIHMAYGRLNVAPNDFFGTAIVTVLRRVNVDKPVVNTIVDEKPFWLKRVVFRAGAESDFGKNLRWSLEQRFGETGKTPKSRNQIMNEPSNLYANRLAGFTDILHEYFIPVERLGEFVEKSRPVFLKYHPDLMNVTIRNVMPDQTTFLRYAPRQVFGLVMLFNQRTDAASEQQMQTFTREVIQTALDCGGTYYLCYRPHATREEFEKGYPMAKEFFRKKWQYDPEGVFGNEFLLNYGWDKEGRALSR